MVVCITASGNSPNVLKAIEYANQKGARTVGLLGFEGGKAKDMVTEHITLTSRHYGQVEDVHMLLCHVISHCFGELVKNSH